MYQRRSSPRETAGAWTPGGATTRPSRISSQLGTHTASRPRASSPRASDRSFSINSKRIRRRQSRLLPPPRAGQSVFALPHLSFTLVKRSIPSPAVVPLKPVIYRGAQRYGGRTSSLPISAGGSRGVPVGPDCHSRASCEPLAEPSTVTRVACAGVPCRSRSPVPA
jgi:hypothetical protein